MLARSRTVSGLILGTSIFSGFAWADPGELAMNVDRVSVFKDGYALVVKKATAVADAAGSVYTLDVPESAVMGTFWVLSDDGTPVIARAEYVENEPTEQPCLSVLDILRANIGRHLTLEGNGVHTGTIVALLEHPRPDDRDGTQAAYYPSRQPGSPMVVLETSAQQRIIFPAAEVQRVIGAGLATAAKPAKGEAGRRKRLSFELGKAAGGKQAALNIFYFTPGVRWVPTYRVEGVNGDKSAMSLQGELINDLEDLTGAQIGLVAGVPNFKFKDTPSPLTLEGAIRRTIEQSEQMRGRNYAQQLSNVAFDDRRQDNGPVAGTPPVPGEIVASAEQDLFVYSIGTMTLKKGARATVPIWSSKPAVRHVYTLDIRPVRGSGESPLYGSIDPGGPATTQDVVPDFLKVWHQVELVNPGPSPWTTGPAMVMQEGLPISQDTLKYVPVKGTGRLPLTVAIDVRAIYKEVEIDRTPNAARVYSRDFVKVRKTGTVSLKNTRSEKSEACITVTVAGNAKKSSNNGVITLDTLHGNESGVDPRVNSKSTLTWELTLDPGQSIDLTFDYEVFL